MYVGRESIEDANIVDDKLPILGYHFDTNPPRSRGGIGPSSEAVSKVDCLDEKVHRDQKRPVLLRSFTHGPCRDRQGVIPVSGEESTFQPSGFRSAVCRLVVLPEVVVFAGLRCLKLLRQSLAQEGPDGRHLRACRDTNRMTGHDLAIQLPHPMGESRLVEEGGKSRKPLSVARHYPARAFLPTDDAGIEFRLTTHAFVSGSNLNQERSRLTVTAKPNLCAKGIVFIRIWLVITGVRDLPPDVSMRRPGPEPVFEALRG
jgi:hypothetical protein